MRITAEEKSATRRRILQAALQSFRSQGFESTTTRDIATAAEIATGTLFNYFATKEAIVEALAEEALAKARKKSGERVAGGDLEEALFAYIADELRQLKPLRKFIAPLLETSLSPLGSSQSNNSHGALRIAHLEEVTALALQHGAQELSPIGLQVYWTLYIGVLTFWTKDKSPKQEDTLALLDQSLAMFVAWLREQPGQTLP